MMQEEQPLALTEAPRADSDEEKIIAARATFRERWSSGYANPHRGPYAPSWVENYAAPPAPTRRSGTTNVTLAAPKCRPAAIKTAAAKIAAGRKAPGAPAALGEQL